MSFFVAFPKQDRVILPSPILPLAPGNHHPLKRQIGSDWRTDLLEFASSCILRRGPVVILNMEYIPVFDHFQKLKV